MYFTDCRIPKENRMGEKGTGFLKLMQKLQQERLVCAIGAVASAEMMVAMTIQYCKERTAFGKPLSKFQHTQFELVEMSTEVKLDGPFLDKLIMDHIEGKNVVCGSLHGQVLDDQHGLQSRRSLPPALWRL